MLRKGALHAREAHALEDGSFLAVTLLNRPPHGVMAWAGRLRPGSHEKSASDIDLDDYITSEKVSFSHWKDVWEYFGSREYAGLIAQLRDEVDGLYPGE